MKDTFFMRSEFVQSEIWFSSKLLDIIITKMLRLAVFVVIAV